MKSPGLSMKHVAAIAMPVTINRTPSSFRTKLAPVENMLKE